MNLFFLVFFWIERSIFPLADIDLFEYLVKPSLEGMFIPDPLLE